VIEEIGKSIVSGQFSPGQALPGEGQLCLVLGVSRTALREALRVLASKGLIEPKRKLGTLVQRSEHWNFLDADILSWLLEVKDPEQVIRELYELRHLLEPVAASLAAKHADDHDIEVLRQAYEAMLAVSDDGAKIVEPDLRFHRAIIAASGNRLFSSLAQVIGSALAVTFKLVRDVPQGHAQSMPLHKRVLEAIEARDASAARVAMQKLIEESQHDARSLRSSARRHDGIAKAGRAARR
jgi:DNA-binding FadR family transcriptional regulator